MIPTLELYYFLILAIVLLVLLWFFVRSVKLIKKKRLWASCRNSTYFLVTLLLLISVSLVGTNLLTYHRLTHESPVAYLYVEQLEQQHYRVDFLHLQNCKKTSYIIQGDEWQVDARIIKWHGWANLLGLDASFQLDRISGRYHNIEQQRIQLPSVFTLETKRDYDLWALKKKYQWLPWLDAKYGQSVFLAMKNAQSYQVYMSQSGLIAREQASSEAGLLCSN